MLLLTLVFIRNLKNKQVLLGYKKFGYGCDKWNGLGGFYEPNENVLEATRRLAKEQADIEVEDLKKIGYVEFQIGSRMNEILALNVFVADNYKGVITETEEIIPKWFNYDSIPYSKMWKDESVWLPMLLDDKYFTGYFLFKDEDTIIEYKMN